MPAIIRPRPSRDRPDYSVACRQTITLYNVNKTGGVTAYHKTVFERSAYLESKRVYQEGKTGVTATSPALLVIPQGASGHFYVAPAVFDVLPDKTGFFTLRNGDKAMPGIGLDIVSASEWVGLIPAKIPDVVTIAAVDPKRNLSGEIVHVEGGGG